MGVEGIKAVMPGDGATDTEGLFASMFVPPPAFAQQQRFLHRLTENWLRVLGTAELTHINRRCTPAISCLNDVAACVENKEHGGETLGSGKGIAEDAHERIQRS